jgi:hypothetical protein
MTIQHFVKTFFMKHFDDDGSKHVLKPSPLDKEAVSGAVTPNSRQNVQRRNDEKAARADSNGAYQLPSVPPNMHSVLIPVST